MVSDVVGIGLLVTPGAQGAGALLLGSAVAGGVAGGSGILDRQKHGNLEWNTETFIDITDLAGGRDGYGCSRRDDYLGYSLPSY